MLLFWFFPSCTFCQISEQDNISNQFVKLLAEHMSEGFKQTQTERCVVSCGSDIRVIHMAPSAGSLCFPPTADSHSCSPRGAGAGLGKAGAPFQQGRAQHLQGAWPRSAAAGRAQGMAQVGKVCGSLAGLPVCWGTAGEQQRGLGTAGLAFSAVGCASFGSVHFGRGVGSHPLGSIPV